MARTDFPKLTAETLDREELACRLPGIVRDAMAFDRNGNFLGASAIKSPVFNAGGAVRYAAAVAGPTERIDEIAPQLHILQLEILYAALRFRPRLTRSARSAIRIESYQTWLCLRPFAQTLG
ncbi:IclR family transcriptional regulator C-terminal domain-containing protein [Novosphingobium sp. BL-8A]|uniref:IclR family transcriptional regulator domain-containing protein n=1 Tax=Novosphingobium sp. BL-8A TaxID=3127639 RepID=UPI003757B23F